MCQVQLYVDKLLVGMDYPQVNFISIPKNQNASTEPIVLNFNQFLLPIFLHTLYVVPLLMQGSSMARMSGFYRYTISLMFLRKILLHASLQFQHKIVLLPNFHKSGDREAPFFLRKHYEVYALLPISSSTSLRSISIILTTILELASPFCPA